MPTAVEVLTVGAGPVVAAALRRAGREVAAVAAVSACVFDAVGDRWRVRDRTGRVWLPRILVAGPGSLPEEAVTGPGETTLARARAGGLAPYLGIALSGLPNLFVLAEAGDRCRARDVVECLRLMDTRGATRIQVREGTQRALTVPGPRPRRLHRRAARGPRLDDFDLTNAEEREPDTRYDGAATLTADGRDLLVEVHLGGHVEPLDGRYHWYGRVLGDGVAGLKARGRIPLTVRVGGGPPTPAALAEQDPWGHYRLTGVGAPPYPLEPVTLEVQA